MGPIVMAALRTAVQSAWGWLVAHFGVLAVIPSNVAVDFILTTVIIGGATVGLRWLETRKGDTFWARAARLVAKVAMLGLSRKQPVYQKVLTPDEVAEHDAARKRLGTGLMALVASLRPKDHQ